MEKRIKKLSLFTWMILLFSLCLIVSFFLSMIAVNILETAQNTLVEMKEISSDINGMEGGVNDVQMIDKASGKASAVDVIKNKGLYNFYEWMLIAAPILIFGLCLYLSAFIFYRCKLKAPIHALQLGIAQIERQDLDFTLSYRSEDELGSLCRAFDTMREKLKDAFVSLWAEKEKQTLLTRALAHDLRTPLTVIKGHNDLIALSYSSGTIAPEQLQHAAAAMGEGIARMEKYLDNAREMQTLEEWQLNPQPVSGAMIAGRLCSINALNHSIRLVVENKTDIKLMLDEALVMRVLENLIANALEHANSAVSVAINHKDDFLSVLVEDDGKGFSPDALLYGTAAFYRGDSARSSKHMGLGLTIAKTLAERHGGELSLGNRKSGAFVCVTFRSL